jgi:hypothetical protein
MVEATGLFLRVICVAEKLTRDSSMFGKKLRYFESHYRRVHNFIPVRFETRHGKVLSGESVYRVASFRVVKLRCSYYYLVRLGKVPLRSEREREERRMNDTTRLSVPSIHKALE